MEYLTPQEIDRLLAVTSKANPDHHLAILLAATTGARTSQILGDTYERRRLVGKNSKGERIFEKTGEEREVRALTGTDVDVIGGRIRVHAAKGGKNRFYVLQEHANPALNVRQLVIERAKMVGSGRLFSTLSRQYLDKCLKKYGAQAGIHPSLCHLHAIRHALGVIVFDGTQRPGAITNFLAHSDESSAFPYLRENDGKSADKAVADYWARLAA